MLFFTRQKVSIYFRKIKILILRFLTEVKFGPSLPCLCCGASCCVNAGTATKIIFGDGTRLTVEPSKY